jgi:hypothetical protein
VWSGKPLPAVPCNKTISVRLADAVDEEGGKGAALLVLWTMNAPKVTS